MIRRAFTDGLGTRAYTAAFAAGGLLAAVVIAGWLA